MKAVDGWEIETLGRVARLTMGQSPDSRYYSEEENGLPFLQGCAEFKGRFPKHLLYCRQAKKIATVGSILFSVRAPVGRINIADRDYIIGRGLAGISGIEVDQVYLEHYLTFVEPNFRNASQGSTFEAINSSELNGWPIEHPVSKTEQTKIAEVLSMVDRAIEQTEALIAKQQRIKTGLMQGLLTRGIDEHGNLRTEETHQFKNSPLGRIPVEWEIKSLGESAIDLVDGDRGENYPKQNDLLEDAYCLFLSAKNVTKSGFRFSENQFITEGKDRKLGSGKLKKLDIVLTTRGTIGNFALFNDSVPYENIRVNSGMMILRNCDPELLPEFVFEALRNFIYEFEYKRIVSGSAQPQLPVRDLKAFHIIKPSVEEQKIIISSITRLNETSENQEKHLVKLRSLKTALMQDLLTGKKRVTALLNGMEVTTV
jgi:type I restriction enzyme S subunit